MLLIGVESKSLPTSSDAGDIGFKDCDWIAVDRGAEGRDRASLRLFAASSVLAVRHSISGLWTASDPLDRDIVLGPPSTI
jgi:hypothetical protein